MRIESKKSSQSSQVSTLKTPCAGLCIQNSPTNVFMSAGIKNIDFFSEFSNIFMAYVKIINFLFILLFI